MSTSGIVLIGCGEHATVVADAVRSRAGAWRITGYTDLAPTEGIGKQVGVPFLGTDQAYLEAFVPRADIRFVIGIAGAAISSARARLAEMYEAKGAVFATVIHATAWISPSARVDPGAVIMAGAIVNSGAHVGAQAIINTGAIIEHHVTIGAFASVAPRAVIGGGARIGAGSYVGLGACIRDHVVIGERTMVAMGAVVVNDVADDSVVIGVPARPR